MGLKAKKTQLFLNHIFLLTAKLNGILNNAADIKNNYKSKSKNRGTIIITVFPNANTHIVKFVNKIKNSDIFVNIIFNKFGELV